MKKLIKAIFFAAFVAVVSFGFFVEMAVAEEKMMTLSEIKSLKPGTKGYGLTVYKGVTAEKFEVEALGVVDISGLATIDFPILVVELTSGPADFPPEKTGIVAGMSGSPVYIDGKLVGALAYKVDGVFSKDALAGITPAVLMKNPTSYTINLKAAQGLSSLPLVLSAPADFISISKKRAKNDDFFNDFILAPQISEPLTTGVIGASVVSPVEFGPGSSVNVYLARGDIDIAVNGTVTMVDGENIYVFGHPFYGLGEVEMYFHQAEVLTTVSSYRFSHKLAGGDVGSAEGLITDDYYSAIKGKFKVAAKMLPLDIEIKGNKASRWIDEEIARHPALTPLLVDNIAFRVINSVYPEVSDFPAGTNQKMAVETEIKFKGLPKVSYNEDYYFNYYNTAHDEDLFYSLDKNCLNLYEVIAAFGEKGAINKIKSIEIRVSFFKSDKSKKEAALEVEKIEKESYIVKQGQVVDLGVVLAAYSEKKYEKSEYKMNLPLPIPETARGDMKVVVGAGRNLISEDDIADLTAEETIDYFNKILDNGLFLKIEYEIEVGDSVAKDEDKDGLMVKDWGETLWKNGKKTKLKKIIYKLPGLPEGYSEVRGGAVLYLTVVKATKEEKKEKEEKAKEGKNNPVLKFLFSLFK